MCSAYSCHDAHMWPLINGLRSGCPRANAARPSAQSIARAPRRPSCATSRGSALPTMMAIPAAAVAAAARRGRSRRTVARAIGESADELSTVERALAALSNRSGCHSCGLGDLIRSRRRRPRQAEIGVVELDVDCLPVPRRQLRRPSVGAPCRLVPHHAPPAAARQPSASGIGPQGRRCHRGVSLPIGRDEFGIEALDHHHAGAAVIGDGLGRHALDEGAADVAVPEASRTWSRDRGRPGRPLRRTAWCAGSASSARPSRW